MIRLLALFLLILPALAAGGCATRTQAFPGYDAESVWTAMTGVARTPEYDDMPADKRWEVTQNEVWDDPEQRRIEIYRRLQRVVYRPKLERAVERREWRFRVSLVLVDGEPEARFTSRDPVIAAWLWQEADRYFHDVRVLLGEDVSEPEAPETVVKRGGVDFSEVDPDR